jgi:GT2 family glycosyltransferase
MLTHKRTVGTIGYMAGIMSLPEPFVWSLVQALQFTTEAICEPDEQIEVARAQYSLHSAARNELVSKMKGDWLLQLDTDMVFDPDFVARLVQTMYRYDLDILTGLYTYKSNPAIPTLYRYNEKTMMHEPIQIGLGWEDSDVFPVDSAGAGCLLVKREVYLRIVTEMRQPPFEMIPPMGEDHSFFTRARKCGYQPYCAWKVQAAHLGYKQVTHQFDLSMPILNTYEVTGFGTRKGEQQ